MTIGISSDMTRLSLCAIGKTTTLAMLTGRARPTAGDAMVNSVSVIHGAATSRALLGFCPQQDPLLDLLTAEEHLSLYARLKVRSYIIFVISRPGGHCRSISLCWAAQMIKYGLQRMRENVPGLLAHILLQASVCDMDMLLHMDD